MQYKEEVIIFVPFYNESKRLGVRDYLISLSKLKDVKFVLVNDGSTDNTLEMLNSFRAQNFDVISHFRNSGKGEALRNAMLESLPNSKARTIGFLDCDGAFPIDTVKKILKISKATLSHGHYQVCIASRVMLSGRKVKRLPHRHYISRVIITLLGFRFAFMPYDSQSGFKLFKNSKQLEQVLARPFKTRWLFDIELLDRLTREFTGNIIWEEPVQEWYDKPGSHLKLKSVLAVVREVTVLLLSRKQ
jgi:glycosyltransferase involved in cell wall biosynthesis